MHPSTAVVTLARMLSKELTSLSYHSESCVSVGLNETSVAQSPCGNPTGVVGTP